MPNIVDLAELPLGRGSVIADEVPGDSAGRSVSTAGDVNGDGYDDVIVGAPFHGLNNDGRAYVLFGGADGIPAVDLSFVTPDRGFYIQADAQGDRAGTSVSSAGDINGDGYDDLIIGAPNGNDGGGQAGEAYVIFGRADGFGTVTGTTTPRATIDLTTLAPDQGFILRGDALLGHVGHSVSDAGDVNGDGFDDLLIGGPWIDVGEEGQIGEAFVLFGHEGAFGHVNSTGRAVMNLAALRPRQGFVIQGDQENAQLGQSVSSAGDVNGDGFADLIIGAAPSSGVAGQGDAGAAYVLFGRAGGFGTRDAAGRAVIGVGGLDPVDGFAIAGAVDGDRLGWSVSSAGDVNGDGFADLIVGTQDYDGAAYVIFGHAGAFADMDVSNLAPGEGFAISTDANDMLGASVSGAGDVNGDGFADLIVGAPNGDGGGDGAGMAYVVFGHGGSFADLDLADLASADGFIVQGAAASLRTGSSVSAAGDLNGDGIDDIIIGAPGRTNVDDDNFAYVIYGRLPDAPIVRTGGAGNDVLRGRTGDDTLSGADGDDQLRGDDGDDALSGDAGADRLFGGNGADTLAGGDGNDALDGQLGADVLAGGLGDDVYRPDLADTLVEAVGEGTDAVRASIDYILADNIEQLFLNGAARTGGGNAQANVLHGSGGGDTLSGNGGDDVLRGSGGRDLLQGGAGDDLLDGGIGRDTLVGGEGRDIFQFRDGDLGVTPWLADMIEDFSRAAGEKVQLHLIDADTTADGDQAFTWIGTGFFTEVAGELRYFEDRGTLYLEGDTNGDAVGDFVIGFAAIANLAATDFVL